MAQAIRWQQERLGGYYAALIREKVAAGIAAGKGGVDYLGVGESFGGAEIVTLGRAARCRCCGERMPKGAQAIQFAYRWVPAFRYRITASYLHVEPCRC